MLIQKIHFEQVPLETVRKMVEEQIRREVSVQYDQAIGLDTADEIPLGVWDQPVAKPAPSSRMRYSGNGKSQSQKVPRQFRGKGRI